VAELADELGRGVQTAAHQRDLQRLELGVEGGLQLGEQVVDGVNQDREVRTQVDAVDRVGEVDRGRKGDRPRDIGNVGDREVDVAGEVGLGGEVDRERGLGATAGGGGEDPKAELVGVPLAPAAGVVDDAEGEGGRAGGAIGDGGAGPG